MDTARSKYLLLMFLLFAALCSSAVLIFKRTDLFPWVGSCPAGGLTNEYYLAYCHSRRYGDYELYSFLENTEPEQIANAQSADLLFLGNSRTQYAFSTDAVDQYLKRRSIDYFVFGFGFGAKMDIPLRLMSQYNINPAVVIVNADPFFTTQKSLMVSKVTDGQRNTRWEYSVKRRLQAWQKTVCADEHKNVSTFIKNVACSGSEETVFRSVRNGFWDTRYFRKDQRIPVGYESTEQVDFEDSLTSAKQFIADTGLSPDCVILTVTPRTDTPNKFAKKLASTLDMPLLLPELGNLTTVDDSHLSPDSAERWSEAILKLSEPLLDDCLN